MKCAMKTLRLDTPLKITPYGRTDAFQAARRLVQQWAVVPRRLILCFVITLAACSSTHDLKRDGFNIFGGGFIDETVGPGLYLIKGFSNTSPIATPDSAAKTFEYRAQQLCPNGYTEVRAVSDAYASMTPGALVPVPNANLAVPGPKAVITSKIGHVLCVDSPLTLYEARMLFAPETN